MPEGMTWERHIQVDSAWPRELPQIERGGHGGPEKHNEPIQHN